VARGHAQAAAATVRWRTAEPRGGVARARESQGGGARAVLGLETTRGGDGSKRWCRGGSGAVVSSANTSGRGAAGEAGGAEHVPEEEEEGRGSEVPRWNLEKPQGLHYKQNFPTDPKL
jgi:hypothetical protein